MASGFSNSSIVSSRYVAALLDMAEDAKLVDKVEQDMADLAAMLDASPDLQALIDNPLISRERQRDGILALAEAAKFQQITGNFLGVLAENRRLPALPAIIRTFTETLRRRRGEVEARVETAYALSKAQTEALKAALAKAIGTQVVLEVEENKELLGGMTVTVGSMMIDDSVRRKLERLERTMSAGSNENQTPLKEVAS